MNLQKKRTLNGVGHLISEKNRFCAIMKEKRVHIFSLDTLTCIHKTDRIDNPISLCMNPEESMLYCITTSNEFFAFDVATWECVHHYRIKPPYEVDEDSWFEINKILCYNDEFLIMITLAEKNILLLEVASGRAERIWEKKDRTYDTHGDVIYDRKTNKLYLTAKKNMNSPAIDTSSEQLSSTIFPVSMMLETNLVRYRTLFMDLEKRFLMERDLETKFLKKTKEYLLWIDCEDGTTHRQEVDIRFLSDNPEKSVFLKKRSLLILLYNRGLIIARKTTKSIHVKLVVYGECLENFELYQKNQKLIAVGWNYGFVIDMDSLDDTGMMEIVLK